jgi:Bacteriophage Lambda NinG protein
MATNKRKCKNCFNVFEKQRSLQYCCSMICAIEHQKKMKKKLELSDWKKRKENIKESLQTLSDLKRILQDDINRLVRMIDYDQLCISSQRRPIKRNAGHYYSVGAHPELRYNLLNIFLQSEHDNSHLSGNLLQYRENVKLLFGKKFLSELESLPSVHKSINLTKDDIKEFIKATREVIKLHLTNYPDVKLGNEKRIELRRQYNELIGIYK